eukprot:CAMPEP_0171070656 /NCGR_PEP_ID=MMETSP0766_2-20121228/9880_1 /TAXON_ID=439317 /ORGANISM="Gambierdiscus australes, Strain CAWD 149" /LENGTH=61 /DNA_ID=CAMNT_0011527155 /DNA_START=561 /DNA_END=746 /DNA_ORIENTATION=-
MVDMMNGLALNGRLAKATEIRRPYADAIREKFGAQPDALDFLSNDPVEALALLPPNVIALP